MGGGVSANVSSRCEPPVGAAVVQCIDLTEDDHDICGLCAGDWSAFPKLKKLELSVLTHSCRSFRCPLGSPSSQLPHVGAEGAVMAAQESCDDYEPNVASLDAVGATPSNPSVVSGPSCFWSAEIELQALAPPLVFELRSHGHLLL